MALWIIAIILAVVFAPILLGTAATLLMVAIPIVLLVFGLVIFVSLFQQAASAVTNPAKCRSYGAAAIAVYVLLLLPPVSNWFFKTNNNWFYQPLLLAGPYALCLMMLSKNRGRGGKKGRGLPSLDSWQFVYLCGRAGGSIFMGVGEHPLRIYTRGGGRNKPCRAGAADDRPRPRRDLTQGEERRRPDCRRTYDKVRVGPFGESVQRITPHRRRSGQGQDLGPDQARVLEPRQARVLGHSQHGCFLRNPAAVPCGYGPVCPLSFLEGESGGGREAEEIK